MSVIDELITTLEASGTLLSYLTGGIHGGDVVEITRQGSPSAFDANQEILPCCLVRMGNRMPEGPHRQGTRVYIDLFFYERGGMSNIREAQEFVYWLLHRQKAGVSRAWEVQHTNDIPATEDPALNCTLLVSQYVVWWDRGEMPT